MFSTCVAPLGCQSIREFGPPRQNSELGEKDKAYLFCSHFAIFARSVTDRKRRVVIAKSCILRSHWQSSLRFQCLWLNLHETFSDISQCCIKKWWEPSGWEPAGCPLVFLLFWLLASSLECNQNKIGKRLAERTTWIRNH